MYLQMAWLFTQSQCTVMQCKHILCFICILFLQLASYLRSGAFAAHGRKPKGWGLSSLITAQQLLAAEDSIEKRRELLERFGVSSASALAPEIRFRSVMCVAQALPVVVAGLQRAVQRRSSWESAVRAGCWLHIQQSLLSDLNKNERSYLQVTRNSSLLTSCSQHSCPSGPIQKVCPRSA